MRIFLLAGAIILAVAMVLLLASSVSYWEWLKCKSSHCGLPAEFDYGYMLAGMVAGSTGAATLAIGLGKKI